MRAVVLGLCSALCLLAAPRAHALDSGQWTLAPRVIEIRVAGDAKAQSLTQAVASELFGRLRVRARVRAEESAVENDEPDSPPWLTAHLDFRIPSRPAVSLEQGRTGAQLTTQVISDVTSLETGIEAALHIVYAAADAALSLPEPAPADDSTSEPSPEKTEPRPANTPKPSSPVEAPPSGLKLGLDLGALGRVVSFGGHHVVTGAGAMGELRADWSGLHAGLLLFGALHATTDVAFGDGYSTVQPFSVRLIPTVDARLTGSVHGSFGFGVGLDQFTVHVARPPSPPPMPGPIYIESRKAVTVDPLLSALVGVRVPSGSGTFVSLLGSLDFGLRSSSLQLGRVGPMTSVFELPDVRASLVLAASFNSLGAPRFSPGAAAAGAAVTE
jgi:hypothetical protein